MKLGNGFAPIPRLFGEKISVCLGTDGAASNNSLDMLGEMRLAALIHKGNTLDPVCLPASEVMAMATVNGARAAGFPDVGRIEPGYKADIILINTDKPHICPVNDPRSAVIYSARADDVDTVIVGGKLLMRERELLGMDEERIMSKAREIAGRIKTGD